MYRQSIIIFGMVIPGLGLLAALVIMWTMLGNFEIKQVARVEALQRGKLVKIQEKALALKLVPRKGQMEYWAEHLETDPTQGLNVNLDDILKGFEGNQLNLTSAKRPPGKGVLGKKTEADAKVFDMTFEGGYGPMQMMMADLEVRMPQLVLEKMSFEPGKHSGKGYQRNLKFNVTYMAWSKAKEVALTK